MAALCCLAELLQGAHGACLMKIKSLCVIEDVDDDENHSLS